ncbi:SCO family protein [Halobacillus litoralis]|uniref:SCO family protein n=1 Tax=Halobacillus litoralis TaxID=45668 RepID=UPI00249078E3|nr:SCO family protein [Halobacillus litoralis]
MRKFYVVLLFTFLLLTGCGEIIEENMSEKVKSFSYTNQNGKEVTSEDLKGGYWITDMIFTSCETVCPPMTGNMARLQQKLKENEIENVKLVSFTIDPETDTPDRLKEFADKYNVDYSNWDFLTGYEFQEIKEFSILSFKNLVDYSKDTGFIHGTNFYLVTPEGKVIKSYDGLKASSTEAIVNDLKTLIK